MWRAQRRVATLQFLYRGKTKEKYKKIKVFVQEGKYTIFYDELRKRFHQESARNSDRKIENIDGTWYFDSSKGMTAYDSAIQKALNEFRNPNMPVSAHAISKSNKKGPTSSISKNPRKSKSGKRSISTGASANTSTTSSFADYIREASSELLPGNTFANLRSYYRPGVQISTPLLRQQRTVHYRTPVKWHALLCDVEQIIGNFKVKLACKKPPSNEKYKKTDERGYKIFVHSYASHLLKNLADYLLLLKQGIITDDDHKTLCEFVNSQREFAETTIGRPVGIINDNRDVDWLHFRMSVE